MDTKIAFLDYQGQTNQNPFLIDVENAKGIYIYDKYKQ